MSLAICIALMMRMLLVILLGPFSASDKSFNFHGMVDQTWRMALEPSATMLILIGLAVEVFGSLSSRTELRIAGRLHRGWLPQRRGVPVEAVLDLFTLNPTRQVPRPDK